MNRYYAALLATSILAFVGCDPRSEAPQDQEKQPETYSLGPEILYLDKGTIPLYPYIAL